MFVAAFLIAFTSAVSVAATTSDEEWTSFRGGLRAAAAVDRTAPTRWSVNTGENIAWRTPIVGRGHSSPVISADRVYVTTAYTGTQRQAFIHGASWLSVLLLAPAAAAIFRRVHRILPDGATRGTKLRELLSKSVLLGTFGALVFLLVFAEHVLDYNRCPIRHWLGTSLLLSLCIALITFVVARSSRINLLCGVAAFLVAVVTILGVPNKDHSFRGGTFAPNSLVVWAFAAVPACLGMLCLTSFGLTRTARHLADGARNRFRWAVLAGAACAVVLALAGSLILGTRIMTAGTADRLPHWPALLGWTVCTLLALAALTAWGIRLDPTRAAPLARHLSLPRAMAGALALMLSAFALGAVALAATVTNSQYLEQHVSRVEIVPDLGWGGMAVALSAVVVGIVGTTAQAPRWSSITPRAGRGALVCLSLIGLLQFAKTNAAVGPQVFTRAIVCLDAHSGAPLWTCAALPGPQGVLHRANSPATPTPLVDAHRVIAYFGSAGLMCANLAGNLLWENRDVAFESAYGVGTSPVCEDDIVVIASGGPDAPYVCALDVQGGRELWRQATECRPDHVSGASRTPLIISLGGTKYIVQWDISALTLFDLHTGERFREIALPVAAGDKVASVATNGRQIFCSGPAETLAIEFEQDTFTPVVRWRRRVAGANCASPVSAEGLLFAVADNGVISCLDAETGKIDWRQRLPGEYFASLLVAGRYLYATNCDGVTTVLAVSREFTQWAANETGRPFYASLAVANGRLYGRDESCVLCIAEATAPAK